jgi:hypothetical protein
MWELSNETDAADDISWDDMRKTDPVHRIEPTKFDYWLQRGAGNRKPPPITLPRIRALETPEPDTEPEKRPSK